MKLEVHHRSNVTLQPRQVRIVILALFAGMVIYTTAAYVLIRQGRPAPAADQALLFGGVLAALGIALLIAATVVGRVRTAMEAAPAADSAEVDRRRLNAHLVERFAKAALAEGFGLVGTTFMLITGEEKFMAAPLVAVWCLLRLLPRPDDFASFDHSIGPGASTHGGAIEP